jgi:hypothetical protein
VFVLLLLVSSYSLPLLDGNYLGPEDGTMPYDEALSEEAGLYLCVYM